jgi:hypothetical protein
MSWIGYYYLAGGGVGRAVSGEAQIAQESPTVAIDLQVAEFGLAVAVPTRAIAAQPLTAQMTQQSPTVAIDLQVAEFGLAVAVPTRAIDAQLLTAQMTQQTQTYAVAYEIPEVTYDAP